MSAPADFRRGIISGDSEYQPGTNASFTIVYGDSRLPCLQCYTEESIRSIDEAISFMELGSEKRQFLEFFFQTKSFKAQLDPAGRFVLPKNLKTKAAINGEVCFAGTGQSFQMWNPESFALHCAELEKQFRNGNETVNPLSILDAEI